MNLNFKRLLQILVLILKLFFERINLFGGLFLSDNGLPLTCLECFDHAVIISFYFFALVLLLL